MIHIVCKSSYILKYFLVYDIGCVINAITIFINYEYFQTFTWCYLGSWDIWLAVREYKLW